jgi:hypothetical protein
MDKYLTKSQQKLFKEWKQKIGVKYVGAVGGQFGLKIIFTSIGEIIIGYDVLNGDEINLTEFDEW